ncbi:MAG: RagB/SusD family nutrient uptake outer membrane protein, partial [Muribaculaceae bacterium]|nr:RagB/SusD family nutrient uptake outer membrane protein [Muribaculaceae bacterium]
MKKLSYLFLFVLGWGIVSSCEGDFLEEVQTNDLDKDVVFADSAYTAGFLSQIYSDAGFEVNVSRMGGGLQTACDEAEPKLNSSGSDVQWARGTVHPMTVTSDAWDVCYRNIRRVNVFLKYADNSMMVESQKTRYKAEARFLRAWYYSILLRQYGGIPLIGDLVIEDAEDADLIKMPRNTYAECVDYIVTESKAAAEDLPYSTLGRNVGRVSQASCYGLISRVKLYAASPLFNGNTGMYSDLSEDTRALLGYPEYSAERWKEAIDASRAVIALNQHRIFSCHYNLFEGSLAAEPGWGFYGIFKA